jgi:hypothetical protein
MKLKFRNPLLNKNKKPCKFTCHNQSIRSKGVVITYSTEESYELRSCTSCGRKYTAVLTPVGLIETQNKF